VALSEADEKRVEAELVRMVTELRNRPSQEKEDRIGVEIAVLPEEERDFVPTALLRILAAERDGGELPEPGSGSPLPPRKRWVNPLRFRKAWSEAEAARDSRGGPADEVAKKDAPH
jgi:hypothetical protein